MLFTLLFFENSKHNAFPIAPELPKTPQFFVGASWIPESSPNKQPDHEGISFQSGLRVHKK